MPPMARRSLRRGPQRLRYNDALEPRFITPARSATVSPSAASARGVQCEPTLRAIPHAGDHATPATRDHPRLPPRLYVHGAPRPLVRRPERDAPSLRDQHGEDEHRFDGRDDDDGMPASRCRRERPTRVPKQNADGTIARGSSRPSRAR